MGSKEDGYRYDRFELDNEGYIDYRKGWTAIREELVKLFPEEKEGIDKLNQVRKEAKKLSYWMVLLRISPSWTPNFFKNWLLKKIYEGTNLTAQEHVNRLFKNPKLKALISGGQLIDWNL